MWDARNIKQKQIKYNIRERHKLLRVW
jgi:hypothetical protein